MNKVLGYHKDPNVRKALWKNLRELKGSLNMFGSSNSEHELAIASNDRRVYEYYLSKYMAA